MMADIGTIVRETLAKSSRLEAFDDATPITDLGLDALDWFLWEIDVEDRLDWCPGAPDWEAIEDRRGPACTVGDLIAALKQDIGEERNGE